MKLGVGRRASGLRPAADRGRPESIIGGNIDIGPSNFACAREADGWRAANAALWRDWIGAPRAVSEG